FRIHAVPDPRCVDPAPRSPSVSLTPSSRPLSHTITPLSPSIYLPLFFFQCPFSLSLLCCSSFPPTLLRFLAALSVYLPDLFFAALFYRFTSLALSSPVFLLCLLVFSRCPSSFAFRHSFGRAPSLSTFPLVTAPFSHFASLSTLSRVML